MRILVTGATGYVGGRLIPSLLSDGHQLRVLARDPERLEAKSWVGKVDVVRGDVLDPQSLVPALDGIEAAYYLVHGMCSGSNSEAREQEGAANFARAAKGIGQVIYLGGIIPPAKGENPSSHLMSRAQVGKTLGEKVNTTEIRVGQVIGSGSAFFEVIHSLMQRRRLIVAPPWITHRLCPISVEDLLAYLVGVLGRPETEGIIDIGTDSITFRDMLQVHAEILGLSRTIISSPLAVASPTSLWLGMATPIPNRLAITLVRGMMKSSPGNLARGRKLFPDIDPVSFRSATETALNNTINNDIPTRWSDALGHNEAVFLEHLEHKERLVREVRTRLVKAAPEEVFRSFTSIGGERGWLTWRWAWALRGFLDQLVGGPGLKRGRRHPTQIEAGDVVDFWRVEKCLRPSLFRLRAEMKVPGQAWLEWEAHDEEEGTRLTQIAYFHPDGILGWLYWYGAYPFHLFLFDALIDAIGAIAMDVGSDSDHP